MTQNEWVEQIINGPGGYRTFVERGRAGAELNAESCARWVLRCLATPSTPGALQQLQRLVTDFETALRGDR